MKQTPFTSESFSPALKRPRLFWQEIAWHTLPPLIYFVGMLLFFPYWDMFWIYSDEGVELIKALLVSKGYPLFSQVWSEQPPLHTHLLALLFQINGPDVFIARLLTLCFTCLMVWAVIQMVRLTCGNWAALASAILLVLLPTFPLLSAAALTGQPALALACVSILGLIYWHQSRSWAVLIFSGVVMGLSLLTKAFTVFLIPMFAGTLLGLEYFHPANLRRIGKYLRPVLVWGIGIATSVAVVSLVLVGPKNMSQLIQPHVAAAQSTSYPPNEQLYSIWFYLQDAWPILLLAVLGVVMAFRQRRIWMLYPIIWMISACGILSFYQPIWSHHQMLITIPAALLAGGAAAEGIGWLARLLKSGWQANLTSGLSALALGLTLLVLIVRSPVVIELFQEKSSISSTPRAAYEDRVMRRINQYAPQTHWIVTDLPMYAFRAGLLVPPNLAVISWKRLAAGDLSEADILATIQEFEPEQVLLGRFKFKEVEAYLQEGYFPVLEREDQLKLYVRKDLLK